MDLIWLKWMHKTKPQEPSLECILSTSRKTPQVTGFYRNGYTGESSCQGSLLLLMAQEGIK